jgi:hypothetical protein
MEQKRLATLITSNSDGAIPSPATIIRRPLDAVRGLLNCERRVRFSHGVPSALMAECIRNRLKPCGLRACRFESGSAHLHPRGIADVPRFPKPTTEVQLLSRVLWWRRARCAVGAYIPEHGSVQLRGRLYAAVAPMVERGTEDPGDAGSSPAHGTHERIGKRLNPASCNLAIRRFESDSVLYAIRLLGGRLAYTQL